MPNKLVVGYDGSDASKRALEHAKAIAKANSSELVLAYVIEWSPFQFLTPEELEQRHKRRAEEVEMAREKVTDPVLATLGDFNAKCELRYGDIANTLSKIATENEATSIIVGRDGHSGLKGRFFGSTASKIVQIADVPVTIVP